MRTKLQQIGIHLFMFVAMLTSSVAWGAGWETWNASFWTTSAGNFFLSGPSIFIVLGNQVPCNFAFNTQLSGGALAIASMTGSGSSACSSISARSLPWIFSAPTAISGSNAVSFSFPVSFVYSGLNCSGTIAATMMNANPNSSHTNNSVTFNASLGPCTLKTNPSFTATLPIQATFP